MLHRIERIVLFSLYVPFWGSVKRACKRWQSLDVRYWKWLSWRQWGWGGSESLAGREGGGAENSVVVRL
jgi:hypothetical protein